MVCSNCGRQEQPPSRAGIKILTLGDSITKGVRTGVKENQTFTFYLGESLKKSGFDVEMIRKGISGENTTEALYRLDRDVIREKPHYVTIMYGTNDAFIDTREDENDSSPRVPLDRYKQNLLTMVRLLKQDNIRVLLMTPIPMGKFWGLDRGVYKTHGANFLLKEYAAAVREVARLENIPLVDHFSQWLTWENNGKDIDNWLTDAVHPNPKGHRLIAAAIFKVLAKEPAIYRDRK